jgi:hypothetical protein
MTLFIEVVDGILQGILTTTTPVVAVVQVLRKQPYARRSEGIQYPSAKISSELFLSNSIAVTTIAVQQETGAHEIGDVFDDFTNTR